MLKRLKGRFARVTKDLRERREARERQEKERAAAKRERERAQRRRTELLAELDRTTDKAMQRVLKKRIAEQHEIASKARREANHRRERIQELTSKIKWGVKRQTILRRKIREAKAQHDPEPAPWMANGHEYHNLTDRARKLLAIFVVRYDGYCTSITREWGTGSLHEDKPTRGFDGGGERMTEFQRDLRNGKIEGFSLGDLLELFGPDNLACADNGRAYAMTEGSGIEQLHDNHVHAFVYG